MECDEVVCRERCEDVSTIVLKGMSRCTKAVGVGALSSSLWRLDAVGVGGSGCSGDEVRVGSRRGEGARPKVIGDNGVVESSSGFPGSFTVGVFGRVDLWSLSLISSRGDDEPECFEKAEEDEDNMLVVETLARRLKRFKDFRFSAMVGTSSDMSS